MKHEFEKIRLKFFTNYKLIQFEKIDRGVMTNKYLLIFNDGKTDEKVIVRIYPKDREHVLNWEPAILNLARQNNVKVPNLIGTSQDFDNTNESFIIYKFVEGKSLDEIYHEIDDHRKDILITDIVNNLKKLSEIECFNYGKFLFETKGMYHHWSSYLNEIFLSGKKHLNNHLSNDIFLAEFETNYPSDSNMNRVKKDLVWLDFHPENIIINDSFELVAFLDFEEVISGDIDMCIGFLYAREGQSDFYKRIKCKYDDIINTTVEESIIEYSIMRLYRIAPYLGQNLPSGKKRDSIFEVFRGLKHLRIMKKKSPWYKLIGNDTNKVASNSQKKKLFFLLVFFSVFVILAFAHNYYYNIIQPKSYSQFWPNNEKIALDYENAPFWFKHENDSIFVDRTLSDSLRKQIYKLVPDTLKAKSAFYQAVNNLTFKSQPNTGDSIFIVYACGLIAVIGVTIRSLYDFIGNASYKNELNINRWWPWYYLRPFIGFLSGAAFYFLYDGGVLELNVQGTSASKLYLMLGLCCLIGFGLNDFIERLRIVSKAIFGVKDN